MNFHVSAKGLAIVGALLTFTAPAMAQDATLDVSAEVKASCTVATTPIAFGQVDVTTATAFTGNGGLDVTCTNGTAWAVSADAGQGSGATLADRHMSNGNGELLSYVLYTDASRTQIWGDGVAGGTTTFAGVGTGVLQSKTVYAKVPGGQTSLPAGTYDDIVNLTVSY
jgi:spore coat protein U-like protein